MAKRVVQIKPKLDASHVGELMDDYTGYPVEQFSPDQLKPHPRNYRDHPQDQIDHLIQSIRENGFYRNVVVANDNTILAGHGVGMPDFENAPRAMQVMVNFKTPEDRAAFAKLCGYDFTDQTKSVWFPDRDHLDVGSVIFE